MKCFLLALNLNFYAISLDLDLYLNRFYKNYYKNPRGIEIVPISNDYSSNTKLLLFMFCLRNFLL